MMELDENRRFLHIRSIKLTSECFLLLMLLITVEQRASPTLQATLCGQSLPKPSGGEILRSNVTTSRCLMRPLTTKSNIRHIHGSFTLINYVEKSQLNHSYLNNLSSN